MKTLHETLAEIMPEYIADIDKVEFARDDIPHGLIARSTLVLYLNYKGKFYGAWAGTYEGSENSDYYLYLSCKIKSFIDESLQTKGTEK